MNARQANHYFAEPENPQMPHIEVFTQSELEQKEEIHVKKLDLDNYYHPLEPPKQF